MARYLYRAVRIVIAAIRLVVALFLFANRLLLSIMSGFTNKKRMS